MGARLVFVAAGTALVRWRNRLVELVGVPSLQAMARTWTVRRWLEHWLVEMESRLRPSTLQAYRSVVRTHLIPQLGGLRISQLRVRTVQRAMDVIGRRTVRGGRLISGGTVHRIWAVLRSALSEARRQGLSDTTPPIGSGSTTSPLT